MRNTKRLDKILANSGFGTRKEIKDILKSGNVKLNGAIVKDGSIHINPFENKLEVFEKTLEYKEYIYLMMNKPKGVISATFDNHHKTVVDLLTDYYRSFDLFPAGRLDIDTEGFVLLSNGP